MKNKHVIVKRAEENILKKITSKEWWSNYNSRRNEKGKSKDIKEW